MREPGIADRTETWRVSLPIDMLLSAVSVLVVAQSSSEIPEGLMNNPVLPARASRKLLCSVLSNTDSRFGVYRFVFRPRHKLKYWQM